MMHAPVPVELFFQRYTLASFVQESLQKWEVFVRAAGQAPAIHVFDSYPFQNSVRILLQMNAALDDLYAYTNQVETLVMPLQPVLVYLSHRDITHTVHHFSEICTQRGAAWTDYVVTLLTRCPYAMTRHLEGFSGVLAFMRDYKETTDWLLGQSRFPRIVLKPCIDRWEGCYHQIETFLELS